MGVSGRRGQADDRQPEYPLYRLQILYALSLRIDIPAIFLHYNKCVNHGQVVEGRHDRRYEEARRAFLIGYDRRVPRLRQASHCIGCSQCTPKCPQGIDIPSQMRLVDGYVERLKQGT